MRSIADPYFIPDNHQPVRAGLAHRKAGRSWSTWTAAGEFPHCQQGGHLGLGVDGDDPRLRCRPYSGSQAGGVAELGPQNSAEAASA